MSMSDKVKSVVEKMKDAGDTPESCAKRFVNVLTDLFSFLKDINEFLKAMSSDGNYPVSPVVIDLAITAISKLDGVKVMGVFSERAIPVAPAIFEKNVDEFEGVAHSIFDGIPPNVIDTIVDLLKNKTVPQDSINDTFIFIHSLVRISIKSESYQVVEGFSSPTDGLEKAVDLFF